MSLLWVHGTLLGSANVERDLSAFIEQSNELVVERVNLQTQGVEVQ